MRDISTEIDLLISCVRLQMGSVKPEHFRQPPERDVDWSYVLRMARKHRLRPLLSQHLSQSRPGPVPIGVLNELQQQFHQSCRRNLRLTHELLHLLRLFNAEGIDAVPYKGPVLALRVFGGVARREFTDLDIVIGSKDVKRATGFLRGHGYEPQFEFRRAQEISFLRHQCENRFHHRHKDIFVDIHWSFAPRCFSFDPGPLQHRLQTISVFGQELRVFSPEDEFLLLSVHGSRHLWRRLFWVYDLAVMANAQSGLDWDAILARGRESGAERMTLLGVFLAHDLLGAAFPPEVLKRARDDRSVKTLAGRVRNELGAEEEVYPGLLEEFLFHLKARERKRDRFQYCLRSAVTPTCGDWDLLHLPAALSPIYYAIRPVRLAIKHGFGRMRQADPRLHTKTRLRA